MENVDGAISPDFLPFLTGLLKTPIKTLHFRALAVKGVTSEVLHELVLGCGIPDIQLWRPESQFSNSASDSD
ncbi:hypothetical protein VARIO8X_20118 [Burkholderiales bacterium 8X]|nr:hypothetical protein VARIO8X_20118 [Burkholderiales bacterium 8X]